MVNIRKKQIKAYLLWESLLATVILASLVGLVLGQLTYHQRQLTKLKDQAQALSVASMCLQIGQDELNKNAQHVTIQKRGKETVIRVNGKELSRVTLLSP